MTDDIPNPDGSSEKRQKFSAAPPMIIDPAKNYTATMVTSKGTLGDRPRRARRTDDGQQLRVSSRAGTTTTASSFTA